MTTSASATATTTSPEKRSKRIQLWSARRLSGLKRSKSTPNVRPVDAMEGSPKAEEAVWREADLREEIEERGEVLESANGDVKESSENAWVDDAASTHTAFKEEMSTHTFEDDGEWAPNLFYAYARRTDDPRFSRFLLTFATARVAAEWWSLLQHHFGNSANTREGPQFFSFTGDDIPGRAWKHSAFSHLRTKWMYSQIGDAVGAMGKGQEIIPLQDERGFPVVQSPQEPPPMRRQDTPEYERAPSRGSFADSLGQKDKDVMARQLKRSSKRDSGILMPSSPLINTVGSSYHERSLSLPVLPPDSGQTASATASQPLISPEKSFDFERMEQNLSRIEHLMESQASQLRSLEHVQAANMERLTAALISNAEMIRELGSGQVRLGEACNDLRRVVREREEKSERMSLRSVPSMNSVGTGSIGSCDHNVKRGPKKIGRKVVGYVYADNANGDGVKTIVPADEVKRK